jgi:hypothetical protein
MEQLNKKLFLYFLNILLLGLFANTVLAQQGTLTKRANTPIPGGNSNGFLEWLPGGYNTSQKYPLIVYINGLGSEGSGSEADLENHFTGGGYPHEQQRQGSWVDEYTPGGMGGQTYRFVIITPQFLTPLSSKIPTPDEVNAVINYSIANYSIDTSRIYLVGQSQGAGAVWDHPGASSAYARRIAAIVPFAGVSYPLEFRANNIKYNNVAVWGFHNFYDALVPSSFTIDYVDFINAPPAPLVPAKKTVPVNPADVGHQIWYPWLRREMTDNGLDIYEWLLLHSKPVSTARAGDFTTVTLPTNSVQLSGSGTGPNGTTTSYSWQKVSGPAGGTFTNATQANTTFNGLTAGLHVFRLTITDNSGATATSDVNVLVNPVTTRYQAEDFISANGVALYNLSTPDEGSSVYVGEIQPGEGMTYRINVPVAGNYKFRFRLASFFSLGQFRVLTSSGTALDTIDVFDTGGYETFLTKTTFLPLAAGQQDIRIEYITGQGWNLNWFEIEQLGGSAVPLPVNFVLFNANCNAGDVNLLWKINASVNSRNFSVEKSTEGRTWSAIGSIPSNTQGAAEQSFTYKDNKPTGNNFYRIVEYGLDGRKTISSVIRSNCGIRQPLTVYPNPVVDKAIVNIDLQQRTKVVISVLDTRGSIVRRQESVLPEGTTQLSIDMTGVAKGAYTLRAVWGNETKNVQLIKK